MILNFSSVLVSYVIMNMLILSVYNDEVVFDCCLEHECYYLNDRYQEEPDVEEEK